MSIKQSAASRTEVGPLQTATVGPDQTAIPIHASDNAVMPSAPKRFWVFMLIYGIADLIDRFVVYRLWIKA
jgi:hypothetical protein